MSQLEFGTKFCSLTIAGSRNIGNFVAIPPYFFYLFYLISYAFIHIHEYLNYKIFIFIILTKWLCLNFYLIASFLR